MSARDTAVIDTLFYDGDDHELMMQFPAMQEGVRSVHAMHLPMQMYGLLWAYDVSVERDPFGEMTLVGDLSALPDVVHDLIDRWAGTVPANHACEPDPGHPDELGSTARCRRMWCRARSPEAVRS